MSKNKFKSQASSSRALPTRPGAGFGSASFGFGAATSQLSYLAEQPDYSSISDSNVVVNFKNLSKKDSTTKSKALEDLQSFIASRSEKGDVLDEAFINAWVKVYPRTSIDASRRVRQLAHIVQGQICLALGKAVLKVLPNLVGAWLSGLHDGDKIVSLAAKDALALTFPTKEKQLNVRKAYQQSILEYSRDAIIHETPQTLSDERSTKPEDAEAKYFRVVSSNLLLLADLFQGLSTEEIVKQQALYEELFGSAAFYSHLHSADSAVRRSTMQCLNRAIRTVPTLMNFEALSQTIFSKETLSGQLGSASDFTQTLRHLSLTNPEIWETSIKGKTPASQLQYLFRQGSRGSGEPFWKNMIAIAADLPAAAVPADLETIKKFLGSIHSGIIRRDEPRTGAEDAWQCYLVFCDRLSAQLSNDERRQLALDVKFPFVRQFLLQDMADSQWTISGQRASNTVASFTASDCMEDLLCVEWPLLTSTFTQQIQTSAPQQSKDFANSQEALGVQGERWFATVAQIVSRPCRADLRQILKQDTQQIMETCFAVVKARNGKPYGAMAVAETAVHWLYEPLLDEETITSMADLLFTNDAPSLILSPSCDYLFSLLFDMRSNPKFSTNWNTILTEILRLKDEESRLNTLKRFLDNERIPNDFDLARRSTQLQTLAEDLVSGALENESYRNYLSSFIIARGMKFTSATLENIIRSLAAALRSETAPSAALKVLSTFFQNHNPNFNEQLQQSVSSELLQNVLLLTESEDDELANQASNVKQSIEARIATSKGDRASRVHELDIVRSELREASLNSLTVDAVVELAVKAVDKLSHEELQDPQSLFPPYDLWWIVVTPFVQQPVPQSLAITSRLGGAVHLMEQSQADTPEAPTIQRDRRGFSVALRIALYSVRVIQRTPVFQMLPASDKDELYRLLQLTVQLASEELGCANTNGIWSTTDPISEEDASDFISETQQLLRYWFRNYDSEIQSNGNEAATAFLNLSKDTLFAESSGNSAKSFQNATAHCLLVSELIELHGSQKIPGMDLDERFKTLRKRSDFLSFASFLSAYSIPLSPKPYLTRYCNELVADLTGADVDKVSMTVLRHLIFFNIIVQEHLSIVESIAKQRVVFFVKHVVPWLDSESVSDATKAELCKALTVLLPAMKEIYSGSWTDIVDFLVKTFSSPGLNIGPYEGSTRLTLIHASLKLLNVLRTLQIDEDCNEDLKEAWQESLSGLSTGLVTVLQVSGMASDERNQPLRITNELLSRQIALTPGERLNKVDDLYPLMLAESALIQKTAFELLHRHIPSLQEQISIDIALDKSKARLPEELLSLILEVPSVESLADIKFDRTIPSEIMGYLASWLLVFDHFRNASDKVKDDYISNLKEGNYLDSLLNFMFSCLGHASGRPLDISKFDVSVYSFDIEESPIRDLQWLLSHLYFLCLWRLPVLTKAWWIECRRAIATSVGSWTEKFFSPLIVSKALKTVSDWADTQDRNSDDAIIVKVNHKAKEVTASREVDDQLMTMVIRLPNNFPFGQVDVEGLNRVAVDEKKWRSWMLTTGAIIFSNDSIVDGLIAFRRNVTGALKGQSECAICYSIVGQDKQLPTKKCGTCKNIFHGSCLFKWFKTSNSSSCPLCRQQFSYV